jgi:IS605 OrfB family transposase
MIRRVQLNISYANKSKLNLLDEIFEESNKVINEFINIFWLKQDFKSKFSSIKVNTWLSVRLQQCLGKQALEIVRSQIKKLKKSKPVFNSYSIILDQRFLDIQFDNNSFDIWIKIRSIGNNKILKLPSRKHKHFHKFNDWEMKKSLRLRKIEDKYFIDFYFEKDKPELKTNGKEIGLDCGYKKLLISSENQIFDQGLEKIYDKISKRKQGSKNFKQSLIERNNKINESVNKINVNEIKTIVVEDLKNVKKNSKGKINKKFNNKLQRWSYSKVLNKLSLICEEKGINLIKVNPSYTSQMCSRCGSIYKESRNGEKFKCIDCGFEIDADLNAAINILHRGVYSPLLTKI